MITFAVIYTIFGILFTEYTMATFQDEEHIANHPYYARFVIFLMYPFVILTAIFIRIFK